MPGQKVVKSSTSPERFPEREFDEAPDSRLGLIITDFLSGRISGRERSGRGKIDHPRGVEKSMLIFRKVAEEKVLLKVICSGLRSCFFNASRLSSGKGV
jgi:hypothetical protein